MSRGPKQTNELLSDLESVLGRGGSGVEAVPGEALDRSTSGAQGARRQAECAADQALRTADPVIVQADRARRVAGERRHAKAQDGAEGDRVQAQLRP